MPADPRVHVDHVVLRVADVERAVAFYGDVLGLAPVGEEGGNATHAALGAPGADRPLVVLRRSARAGPAPRRATGLFHTALRWPDRAGLASALVRVLEARHPLAGASDHGVSEALYLDDPDGNGVELYRDRPREQWPAPGAPGERVGMFTAALDMDDLLTQADERPAIGADVGHVHLKVADLPAGERFWEDTMGLERMARYGDQAAFLAAGGYHHHIGLNVWMSRGADPGNPELPGLEAVGLAYPDTETLADARARLEGKAAVPAGVSVVAVPA